MAVRSTMTGGGGLSSTAAPVTASTDSIFSKVRQLVRATGAPPGLAAELLTTVDSAILHDLFVESLLDSGVSRRASVLSELEAVSGLVRLLAAGTGDPNGDTVTRDFLIRVAEREQSGPATDTTHSVVAQMLRSQTMVHALLDLLARHSQEFDRGESVYLQWEALKALRLVMTPTGLLSVGAAFSESSYLWPEEDHGSMRNGDLQRQLVEVLLQQLRSLGDSMGQKPKVTVLGSLWSLANTSNFTRTRILQAGGEDLVASLFRLQVRKPPLVEAAMVVECGVLVALAGGSRVHERKMAKLGVDQDALEMLRKFDNHREVVCAGLVLLALLANDETVAARLTASADFLQVISVARKRWPEEVEQAFKSNVHYISPNAAALIKGAPPVSARHQSQATQRAQSRNRSSRGRPVRAAALCVVGGAGA